MEHNDFVSQGAIGKNDAVHRNYEAICAVILRFLDAYLKGDAQALAALQNPRGRRPAPTAIQGAAPCAAHQRADRKDVRQRGSVEHAGVVRAGEECRSGPADGCGGSALRSGAQPRRCRPADLGRADSAEIGAALRARSAKRSRQWETRRVRAPPSSRRWCCCRKMAPWTPDRKRDTRKAIEEGLKALRK